jgi:hypothetical protein
LLRRHLAISWSITRAGDAGVLPSVETVAGVVAPRS